VPVITASIAGLSVSLSSLTLWPPLLLSIKLLGDVSIPLLLFSLGVRLTQSAIRNLKIALVGTVLCPLSGLLVAWPMTQVLNLPDQQTAMLLIFGALPPAVLNYVFAEKYGQAPATVASIVMMGNLGSLLIIPTVLYFVLN
jgi:predicted permease